MNRRRLVVGLGIAVLVGLVFSFYAFRTFKRISTSQPEATDHIVVANRPLQLGTRLDSTNIRVINWPRGERIPGMFHRIQDCEGRALIAPVAENEPILESRLAPKEAGAGLPAAIPEGMRAVSVAVNDVIGVAGFVVPGTMVDVLVTGPMPGVSGPTNNITRTILEDTRVLAAGQKVSQDPQGKPKTVSVVTLLVSPEEADELTMASTEGKIQLALRNTIDAKLANPQPVMQGVLFARPTPPRPVRLARRSQRRVSPRHAAQPMRPVPYTVEVITGTKRETKTFDRQ